MRGASNFSAHCSLPLPLIPFIPMGPASATASLGPELGHTGPECNSLGPGFDRQGKGLGLQEPELGRTGPECNSLGPGWVWGQTSVLIALYPFHWYHSYQWGQLVQQLAWGQSSATLDQSATAWGQGLTAREKGSASRSQSSAARGQSATA